MRCLVKFESALLETLQGYLLGHPQQHERHAFLYCHIASVDGEMVYFPKQIMTFDEEAESMDQGLCHVRVDKKVLNDLYLDYMHSEYSGLISCHSHPFEQGSVDFSSIDDANDQRQFNYFYDELAALKERSHPECSVHMASMVFGQNSIAARGLERETGDFYPLQKIVAMGETLQNIVPTNAETSGTYYDFETLQRQELAFGREGMQRLSAQRVAIIGAGGTGSIAAEGICRLGVQELILVDSDTLERSNLNRWQGATPADVGEKKVAVLARHLKMMFPDIQIDVVDEMLFSQRSVDAVKHADLLLGCIDDNKARYFMNRISLQYLVPYIDCSSGIRVEEGQVVKLGTRLAMVIPTYTACLDCSKIEYWDEEEMSYAFSDPYTRQEAIRRKYIDTQEEIPSPAVYPLNMLSVSMLLMEVMNLFAPYKSGFYNIYANYIGFDEPTPLAADLEKRGERADGQCLICQDYAATGDSESLKNYFSDVDHTFELPAV